jgi:hypothetical protein
MERLGEGQGCGIEALEVERRPGLGIVEIQREGVSVGEGEEMLAWMMLLRCVIVALTFLVDCTVHELVLKMR